MMRIFAMLVALAVAGAAPGRPPNVVLLFCDDLGYADVGCFGATAIRTPHIDGLARAGCRMTDFYVAQAVCSASRAALMTGCYPNRVGILGALSPEARIGIAARETTLAEVLKAKGYATAIYGKWHLGRQEQFLPPRHGFDEYHGLPYSNDMWPNHAERKRNYPPLPLIEGLEVMEQMPDQRLLTEWATARAEKFIDRNRDRPFFLYMPYSMPHVPLHVSEPRAGRSAAGLYGDVVEEIDASVGRVLAALDRHGLANDTVVIFTSDNGPWLAYGPHAGSAGPLREGKGTSFEGGARVPFIVRYPGVVPAGVTRSTPAMTIDLLPTLAKWCGADLPKLPIDGRDVSRVLAEGAASPQEAYYFWYGAGLEAVRMGRWKLHYPHPHVAVLGPPPEPGLPGKTGTRRIEKSLYDLEADIGETTNVIDRHPDVVAAIDRLAEAMREELGDSLTKRTGRAIRPADRLP